MHWLCYHNCLPFLPSHLHFKVTLHPVRLCHCIFQRIYALQDTIV